eukprot:8199166-Pyramimonas_sp.AAC.1
MPSQETIRKNKPRLRATPPAAKNAGGWGAGPLDDSHATETNIFSTPTAHPSYRAPTAGIDTNTL